MWDFLLGFLCLVYAIINVSLSVTRFSYGRILLLPPVDKFHRLVAIVNITSMILYPIKLNKKQIGVAIQKIIVDCDE